MSKFRDGMFGPTVILFAICFIATFALAGVYNVTAPVIEQGAITAANNMRRKVLPEGEGFTELTTSLPEGVNEAYKADNGAGYVFIAEAKGFGGAVVYMIGVNANGEVVGIENFSHSETPGLGTKIFEKEYLDKYMGDINPDSVDAVTGATKTSNSLKNSLKEALEAYNVVKEAA